MTPQNDEQRAIFEAVDVFAEAMKEKLAKKERDGWEGWDEPGNEAGLKESMVDHILERCICGGLRLRVKTFSSPNLVDIANFCMFLWNIAQKHPVRRDAALPPGWVPLRTKVEVVP